eukprot:TRINITY_DN17820_c0_g1_i1.p1 TRINITY_DN17820_c0_g1~~TRINITY_DN17820_c0_g1_i1.p1  ORF type:complete len:108 (-),score=18.84 TRINITY_DN17820_c0_g1_i1:46-369(-)
MLPTTKLEITPTSSRLKEASFSPYEKVKYASSGTGQTLMQPLLDNQVGKKNQTLADPTPLSEGKAVDLVKDAFASATERDIYTGDYVDVCLINAAGVQVRRFDLRKD